MYHLVESSPSVVLDVAVAVSTSFAKGLHVAIDLVIVLCVAVCGTLDVVGETD